MKIGSRLLMTALVSVGIAWGLSYLPAMQSRMQGADEELAVFRELRPVVLSHDNLVDYLSDIPAKLPLRQADWSYQMLALDYEWTNPSPDRQAVYDQLVDAIRYGLAGTSNVERVLVRIFLPAAAEAGAGRGRLLVAVEARRGQFDEQEYEMWRLRGTNAEEWLSKRFQFTRTKRWEELNS